MAKTLNPVGTFNNDEAIGETFPGKSVLNEAWEHLVEDQHYCTAYRVRRHAGHAWLGQAVGGITRPGSVRAENGGTTTIKFYCYPRIHATTLYFVAVCDTNAALATVVAAVINDGTGALVGNWAPAALGAGAGLQPTDGAGDIVGGIAGGTLYRVEVTLTGPAGAGNYIELRSFAFCERDLTGAELTAI